MASKVTDNSRLYEARLVRKATDPLAHSERYLLAERFSIFRDAEYYAHERLGARTDTCKVSAGSRAVEYKCMNTRFEKVEIVVVVE